MRKVALVSALSAAIGYAAVYFAFFSAPAPAPVPAPAAAPDLLPAAVLADVVEVKDPAALLDAKPADAGGVPFDPVIPASFVAPAAPPPIPPAADDEVPAPRPKAIRVQAEEEFFTGPLPPGVVPSGR